MQGVKSEMFVKIFHLLILVILILATILLGYEKIDSMLTISYLKSDLLSEQRSIMQLLELLEMEMKGRRKDEILAILKTAAESTKSNGEVILKEEDGAIWYDQIQFHFNEHILTSIGD